MNDRTAVLAVAGREFKTRMFARSSIVSLAIMLAVIIVGGFVGGYFLNREEGPDTTYVALTAETTDLAPALEQSAAAAEMTLEIVDATEEKARSALAEGDGEALGLDESLDAAVVGSAASPTVLTGELMPDQALLAAVAAAAQSVTLGSLVGDLGGDPAQFGSALAAATPQVESVAEDAGFDGPAYLVAMIALAFLVFGLILTGTAISTGVVEEKTSRVVEILLATIKPSQLLAGKVLGIGLYGLIQVLLLGGVAAAVAVAVGLTEGIDVGLGSTLAWLLLWFLIGYLTFALLWGGFSALVSRQEDIGAVTTPLTFLIIVPFYVAIYLVPNSPEGTVTNVLSYTPFFAPFLMPVRHAFGSVGPMELLISAVISIAVIPALVWIAGRVYSRGVLHTGGRMKLGEALRG